MGPESQVLDPTVTGDQRELDLRHSPGRLCLHLCPLRPFPSEPHPSSRTNACPPPPLVPVQTPPCSLCLQPPLTLTARGPFSQAWPRSHLLTPLAPWCPWIQPTSGHGRPFVTWALLESSPLPLPLHTHRPARVTSSPAFPRVFFPLPPPELPRAVLSTCTAGSVQW